MRLTFLFLLITFTHLAMSQDSTGFTLEQAVQYALDNHIQVKNARLDYHIAKAATGEVLATGLPQVNGNVQLMENTQLRRMFFEYQPGNPFLPPGTAQPGEIVAVENLFQLPSTGDASVSLNQLIFSASYFVGLKAAKVYTSLAETAADQTEIEKVEAVQKAYYLVLINQVRLELFEANLQRLDTVLKETRALYEAGFAEKLDVDRLEVNYNNLETDLNNLRNLYLISKQLLKFQMGYPMDQEIIITQGLEDVDFQKDLEVEEEVFEDRAEYRMAKIQMDLEKLDLKNYRLSFLPTVSGFGSLGVTTQNTGFWKLFSNEWYPYHYIGVNVDVPIFNGLGRMYQIKQAKLRVEKAENNLELTEQTIVLQVNQARTQYLNAIETLESRQENYELAREVARVTNIKYQEGVGSNLEVVTAETSLKEAQTAYMNALYEVIVAKIDYKRALGNLYQP